MVIFQICRLVGDNRIRRRVRLVEGVFRKIDHLIVNMVRRLLVDPIRNTALYALLCIAVDEILAFFLHDCRFFLCHRTAHQVASSPGIASQIAHDLHNLLLIDDTAIGRRQNRF